MDFEQRLQEAIERGQHSRRTKDAQAAQQALSVEELKRLHTQFRLEVSDHVERCLKKLVNHFPGFEFAAIVSEKGWGAELRRDDVSFNPQTRRRDNLFSRLEMVVRPFSSASVLDLAAKGTIRNKEVFARAHFQRLAEADPLTTIDDHGLWLDPLISLAAAIEIIALAVTVLIAMSAIAAVVFTTRTGLAIHHDVIELLHLMGARDDYVARQFQVHHFWLGLKGGIAGIALTVVTLIVLGTLTERIEATLLPRLTLSVLQWVVLLMMAGGAALISMITARITVMRALRRMP